MPASIDLVIPAFNAAGVIEQTIRRISEQKLPDDCLFHVYVLDDASTDDTPNVLARLQKQHDFLRVVRSDRNVGRGEARNRGAAAGFGSIIVMCDADCRYTRDDALLEFVGDIEQGADAVIGVVELEGRGFWPRYTNSVIPDRIEDYERQGLVGFGATPNMAIRRSTFEALGGFAGEYRHYGFEDKDFLVRLEKLSDGISLRPDIRASHDDDLRLATVCRKFAESGELTAPIFRAQHPEEYARLPYTRCDARGGAVRKIVRLASKPISLMLQWIGSLVLVLPLPFRLQRAFVRAALCAAYFHGTARHLRSSSNR